jgi:hypothetical protein
VTALLPTLVGAPPDRDRPGGLFERVGDIGALSVLRIALGLITLAHLWPFLADARAGLLYDDHFWQPYVSWAPHLPGDVWALLVWMGAASAVLMSLGILTRLTTTVTFVIVAGNLLLSGTHFRHNRAFLAILLGGMALLPTGRVCSVDAWRRRRMGRGAHSPVALIWPLVLLRVQVSLVYFSSGFSKLVDPDWVSGLVLWDRVVRYQHVIHPAPDWAVDLLTWRPLFYVVAPAAIAIELFLAAGLWSPGIRLVAIRLAILFHLAIEVSASVEVFSLAAVAALVIWVTPRSRDRTIRIGSANRTTRLLQKAVPALDWLARFRVEAARPGDPDVVVEDRDGTMLEGRAAVRFTLERLPATFLIAPLVRP